MWLKGSIHIHTNYGDGELAPEDIFHWYNSNGYNFIAFTDHNKITNYNINNDKNFIIIENSIEFGRFETDLHILGIGLKTDKIRKDFSYYQEKIDYILKNDGIPIINHPNWKWTSCSFEMLIYLKKYVGIEVFNTLLTKEIGSPYALEKWDYILSRGIKAWGFAVDDLHGFSLDLIGKGWIMVKVDFISKNEILKSIIEGNFYASNGAILKEIYLKDNYLYINSANGEEIVFIADNGKIINTVKGREANIEINKKYKYVRAEIRCKEGIAFSQPFFI
ncbi:MAG: hypothetical protein M1479_07730 [Actinobacteria bacterium]|nr:hypothetical protein [Cyanobacteriota bacterium]MCL5772148.1 hypothetical protein [Actinomycetota bacterium]